MTRNTTSALTISTNSEHTTIIAIIAPTTTKKHKHQFISTARIVCGAGSMQRSVVRPCVCLSRRSTAATAAGGFAAERQNLQQVSIDSCGRRAAGAEPALSTKYG